MEDLLELVWNLFEMAIRIIGLILENLFIKIRQRIKGVTQRQVELPAANYEPENSSIVREVVATAISDASLHPDIKGITAVMILAKYLRINDEAESWSFEISVTASAQVILGKDISGAQININRVLKNKKTDAIKNFNDKQVELTNSSMTADEKNRIWRQFYSNNCHRLKDWMITDFQICNKKITGNIEVKGTPEVQQFSPQQVMWVDKIPPWQSAP